MNTLNDNAFLLKNILLDLKNNSVTIAYLEDNIIPLFNLSDKSLIPMINYNINTSIEQFPLFSLLINNGFKDLKIAFESQLSSLKITNSMDNLNKEL
jgi:hypothetical protein